MGSNTSSMDLNSELESYSYKAQEQIKRIIECKDKGKKYFIIKCHNEQDMEQIINYLVFTKNEYELFGSLSTCGAMRHNDLHLFQPIIKK